MMQILGVILFIALLVMIVAITTRMSLNDAKANKCSKYIVNKFALNSVSPKLGDMIHYHEVYDDIRYVIKNE